MNNKVAITYAWGNIEHEGKVLSLWKHLTQYYDIEIDRHLAQSEASIDFGEMMHRIMTDYGKVIVVLSPEYKEKADNFKNGVGTEYRLIINDIEPNKNKYILVCFGKISDEIKPLAFKNRQILNLDEHSNMNELYAKISDVDLIEKSTAEKKNPPINRTIIEAFYDENKEIENRKENIEKAESEFSAVDDALIQEFDCFDLRCFDSKNSKLIKDIVDEVFVFGGVEPTQIKELELDIKNILRTLSSYFVSPQITNIEDLLNDTNIFPFKTVYKPIIDYINEKIVIKCKSCNKIELMVKFSEQLELGCS